MSAWHKRHNYPLGLTAAIWACVRHPCQQVLTQYGINADRWEIGNTDIVITCPNLAFRVEALLRRMQKIGSIESRWYREAKFKRIAA